MSDFDALAGWIDALASTEVDEFAREYTYKALTATLLLTERMGKRISALEDKVAELEAAGLPERVQDLHHDVHVSITDRIESLEAAQQPAPETTWEDLSPAAKRCIERAARANENGWIDIRGEGGVVADMVCAGLIESKLSFLEGTSDIRLTTAGRKLLADRDAGCCGPSAEVKMIPVTTLDQAIKALRYILRNPDDELIKDRILGVIGLLDGTIPN